MHQRRERIRVAGGIGLRLHPSFALSFFSFFPLFSFFLLFSFFPLFSFAAH